MANATYMAFIIVYFVVMVAVGLLSRRFTRGADGFFVAGRKGKTILITGSLVATIVGGSATVGMAGMGFSWGLTGMWWLLVGSVGLIILGLFLAKKLRSTGYYTLPQLAENQYDKKVSVVTSALIVVAWIGIIAGQIVAAGKIMDIIGIGDKTIWMIIFTAVFILYTIIGGQRANLRTDIFQSVIIFGGIIAALAVVLPKVGGWSGLEASLPADHFSFPLSDNFGGVTLATWLLLYGMTYVIGPDMYSRLFSAKNEKVARNSVLMTAVLIIPFALCIVLLGMSAKVLFPAMSSAEAALPLLIRDQLPLFAGGLVMAAFVGAMMSSSDTCLVSTGTILSNDIVKKLKPSLSEEKTVLVARISIVVIGVLALLLALQLGSVISSLIFAYTVYTCAVVIPVFAGFYKDKLKLTNLGAIAAIIGGGTVAILSKFLDAADYTNKYQVFIVKYLNLEALALSALLLFIVSYIDRRYRSR